MSKDNREEYFEYPSDNGEYQISCKVLKDGTKVILDPISDTYITPLSSGEFSYCHCDHFGLKSEEDFKRANHQAFVAMLDWLDEDELEEVRKINKCEQISDLYTFKDE